MANQGHYDFQIHLQTLVENHHGQELVDCPPKFLCSMNLDLMDHDQHLEQAMQKQFHCGEQEFE